MLRSLKSALFTLTVIFLLPAPDAFGQSRPNVVIILTDDQGWGDLSLHGNTNIQTPHLDQLAREGAQFSRFFVCPVCSPTRAELLTGRWHPRGGVFDVTQGGERLDLDETTIADLFQRAGYRTALFGKWHNGTQGAYHPIRRGFDTFYGFTSGHWGHYFSPMLELNDDLTRGVGYLPDDLTTHAVNYMNSPSEQPFFVLLSLNTPHSPMQVPDVWWHRVADRPLNMRATLPDREDPQFTRAAIAMVENIDWNVGRLLQSLRQNDRERSTIVAFLSDNGPNSDRWNGDMRGRKGTVDEGGVRSPLFIRFPGTIQAGTNINHIAGAVDLLPTLTSLVGIAPAVAGDDTGTKPPDGRDLSTLLRDPQSDWSDRYLFAHWAGRVSVRSQKFRLDDTGRLYDPEQDPRQQHDLSLQLPEIHREHMDAAAWYRSHVLSELTRELRPLNIDGEEGNRITLLPARDARLVGQLQRSSRHPNCSWITNWSSPDDRIEWDIEVMEEGEFDVEMLYTCEAPSVGSQIMLIASADETVSSTLKVQIREPVDSPLIGPADDRVARTESPVRDFGTMKMGRMKLSPAVKLLTLVAVDVATDQVADFRLLKLTRVD